LYSTEKIKNEIIKNSGKKNYWDDTFLQCNNLYNEHVCSTNEKIHSIEKQMLKDISGTKDYKEIKTPSQLIWNTIKEKYDNKNIKIVEKQGYPQWETEFNKFIEYWECADMKKPRQSEKMESDWDSISGKNLKFEINMKKYLDNFFQIALPGLSQHGKGNAFDTGPIDDDLFRCLCWCAVELKDKIIINEIRLEYGSQNIVHVTFS